MRFPQSIRNRLYRSRGKFQFDSLNIKQLTAKIEEDTVLLIGSARSGTTWFAEAINADKSRRVLFEPFQRKNVRAWPYPKLLYLRREDSFKHHKLFSQMLLAKHANDWVNQVSPNNYRSRKFLVKEIRLHMMLPWIRTQFPSLKVIYILREPYATALSAKKRGWPPKVDKTLLENEKLMEDFPEFKPFIRRASTVFEKNIIKWAVENRVAIDEISKRPDNTLIVYYEDFKRNSATTYREIEKFIGKNPLPKRKINKIATKRSRTDLDKKKETFEEKLSKLTKREIRFAEEVLEASRLNIYYENYQPTRIL